MMKITLQRLTRPTRHRDRYGEYEFYASEDLHPGYEFRLISRMAIRFDFGDSHRMHGIRSDGPLTLESLLFMRRELRQWRRSKIT